ncbi:MAG: response regulator transcription factor [Pelagibacterales bacterium]|nr:response regulator transcription factor [Pelagibacterales bacterium]
MIKQNINIVGMPILYNILEEIKENLSFKIENFTKPDDFLNFFNEDKSENKNFFIITTISNKDFFINKIKLERKNIFFLCQKNIKVDINHNYNVFKYPINIYNLIEKINIQLIKYKYSFQSKIRVKNYSLDLNSRTISIENESLKLTEREMEIILFLNDCKTPQKINDLQNKVWSYSSELETHTVETHIYRLRKKISNSFQDEHFIISTDNGYFIE